MKENEIVLNAMMQGVCIPVEELNDTVFSDELIGKGIAIEPSDGKVYAPCDGEISMLFQTGHALGMLTKEGLELLIHVGIDTMKINKGYFKVFVTEGQRVRKGDLLLSANLEAIIDKGCSIDSLLIICNSEEVKWKELKSSGFVNENTPVMRVCK